MFSIVPYGDGRNQITTNSAMLNNRVSFLLRKSMKRFDLLLWKLVIGENGMLIDVTDAMQECRWIVREMIRSIRRVRGIDEWGDPISDLKEVRRALLSAFLGGQVSPDSDQDLEFWPDLIVVPSKQFDGTGPSRAAITIQVPDRGLQVWRKDFVPFVQADACKLHFMEFFGWPTRENFEELPYYLVRIKWIEGRDDLVGFLGLVDPREVRVFLSEDDQDG